MSTKNLRNTNKLKKNI